MSGRSTPVRSGSRFIFDCAGARRPRLGTHGMHAPGPERAGGGTGRRALGCIALLWLAGNGMRMTILAVPPLIPLIHDDFHMSETEVGILAGLPVALFACAAVPGSLLIARFGALATAIAGLLITALGSVLRGAAPNVLALYAAT